MDTTQNLAIALSSIKVGLYLGAIASNEELLTQLGVFRNLAHTMVCDSHTDNELRLACIDSIFLCAVLAINILRFPQVKWYEDESLFNGHLAILRQLCSACISAIVLEPNPDIYRDSVYCELVEYCDTIRIYTSDIQLFNAWSEVIMEVCNNYRSIIHRAINRDKDVTGSSFINAKRQVMEAVRILHYITHRS